jgi:hypothetical protein
MNGWRKYRILVIVEANTARGVQKINLEYIFCVLYLKQ